MKNFTFAVFVLVTFLSFHLEADATCNWKSQISTFSVSDTCKTGFGSITLKNVNCTYLVWSINGTMRTQGKGISGFTSISFPITANGTYNICVKVTDTCNKCDTTVCATLTITCFKSCNWKARAPNFTAWDTCKGTGARNSVNAYISFNSSTTCSKYSWTVNGNTAPTKNNVLNYPVTANGTYTICVKVTDTCKKCDTTFCSTRTITCFSSPCDWKKAISINSYSSCINNKDTIKAYISSQYKIYCAKLVWTLNGKTIAVNSTSISYPVTQNGSYQLCVRVTDTCNKCDSTICKSVGVTCLKNNCPWYTKSPNMTFWDTCKGTGGPNSTTGYIGLSSRTCQKYIWTVNGVIQSTKNYYFHYPITANGTYVICVKVMDTCNNCDTTFCTTRTFTCFPACNWKSKTNYYFWDTCKGTTGRNSLNAYVALKSGSCYKYQWTVNNASAGNGNIMHYNITGNGTYNVCVKITDTCNKCDTVFCSTRTISCFPSCNWKAKINNFYTWDTCIGSGSRNSVNAYIAFKTSGCYKYQWTVNSAATGNGSVMHYNIANNGTYNICVKVIDTCNKCDTTICSSRTITCFNTSKCNWKGKAPNYYAWDTCKGKGGPNSINAYLGLNSRSCQKYTWTVNGAVQATKNYYIHYPITGNGTYNICVKVTDTCNKCDTTFCTTRTITCFNACNFASKKPATYLHDSCYGGKSNLVGYISFANKSCLKYLWTVGGIAVSTNYYFNAAIYKNGTYTICVKVSDTCNKCDTTYCFSKTINCSSLGLNTMTENELRIYPNPVQQTLNIDWGGSAVQFEVVNMIGSLVYKGKLETGINNFATDNWSNGIYLVRIHSMNGTGQYKIVVNHQ